jgi:hypothetical protein
MDDTETVAAMKRYLVVCGLSVEQAVRLFSATPDKKHLAKLRKESRDLVKAAESVLQWTQYG